MDPAAPKIVFGALAAVAAGLLLLLLALAHRLWLEGAGGRQPGDAFRDLAPDTERPRTNRVLLRTALVLAAALTLLGLLVALVVARLG